MAKVIIDRELCIGCGACWGTCPAVFEQNGEDGLSQIKAAWQCEEEVGVGRIGEDLDDCAQEAADGCPVSAITLE